MTADDTLAEATNDLLDAAGTRGPMGRARRHLKMADEALESGEYVVALQHIRRARCQTRSLVPPAEVVDS